MKRMLSVAGAAAFAMLLWSSTSAAQTQVQTIQIAPGGPDGMPMQFPAPGRQLKTGTGRIRGRLVSADTGSPLRRAQVRISSPDIMPKVSTTDAQGRYEFRDLPAGRFSLNATKAGYVSVSYGQTRPFEGGKGIDLGEGQAVDKADITMPRGSAISGRIVDEFGEPIADAQVMAMRSAWANGRRRLQPSGRSSQTNDLGQYRIYGLPPGEYYVSATANLNSPEVFMDRVATAATFVNGVALGGASGPGPSGSDPKTGYAPTYFPGTSNGSEAQRIPLAVGQEASADFSLIPVRFVKVTGTVVGSEGRPVEGASLQVVPKNANDVGAVMFPMAGSARSDRNGMFTFNNIAPGEYTLQVRGVQTITTTRDGGDTMVFSTRVGGGDGQSEYGSVPLTVGGDDVANVIVVTSKGASVSGRIVFEGGSKPANTAPLRVSAAAVDGDGPMGMPGGSASVTADGAFEIKGLMGQRLVRPTGLPAGWILKSVTLNGADITDDGVTVKPNQPVTGIEIVVTSKKTELNGAVTAGNQPATDYTVVVFSEDAEKWTAPQTRHVRSARPNQEGRYSLENLPPGGYYAIAVEYIAQGDWNDPDVLNRLKANATRFSISEGEVQTLNLRLSGN